MSFFVAEVASNHNQDRDRCLELITTAARIGCHAVKFQLFRIDRLFAPEILTTSEEHRQRRQWELSPELVPELAAAARAAGIQFACTPFDLQAVEELFPVVDFYKIASYELVWHHLLRECAASGKPVVLSTGMATETEIDAAVSVLAQAGCRDLTLLHCVSSYPVPAASCNLAAIARLRQRYAGNFPAVRFGWSDHSVQPGVLARAIHHWGAEMIEFHLDLDGQGAEYGGGHCWLPDEIEAVIGAAAVGLEADGDGVKKPMPCEEADRDWRADPEDGLRPLRPTRETWHLVK